MKTTHVCLAAAMALGLSACGNDPAPATPAQRTDPPVAPVAPATPAQPATPVQGSTPAGEVPGHYERLMAHVELAPTQGNEVSGMLMFDVDDNGALRLQGDISGLQPGAAHGFHIHETGDCSAPDATSAGGHFNPGDDDHGRRDHGEFHAGDMDNLIADEAGNVTVDKRLDGLEMGTGGERDIVGKAVIVHAEPDDYQTQPTGDAGARLACGVIGEPHVM